MGSERIVRSIRNMHRALCIIAKVSQKLLIDRDPLMRLMVNVGSLSTGSDVE